MVHIRDEGSHFDAPLDIVWKYLQADAPHGEAHSPTTRNHKMTPINETSFSLSMERLTNGSWVKEANRITVFPPVALAVEITEGPLAGSKFVNIYEAKGGRTGINVYGDFMSKQIPAGQLEPAVMKNLENAFNEDSAAIKAFAAKP
ncbi:MAG: hypothetical protein L3K13_05280 [Thermoplasmata archaeon]|nr:hypothetical protein [Thermoplasmata archaeon]